MSIQQILLGMLGKPPSKWASSANMAVARGLPMAFGSTTSAIVAGGEYLSSTENFNGTSFSTGATLTSLRSDTQACGSTSAGMTAGGNNTAYQDRLNTTEKFNGTTWSTSGNLLYVIMYPGIGGSQTSAVQAGGDNGSSMGYSSLFNGTSWTATGNMPVNGRGRTVSAATNSAAFSTGGLNTVDCATFNGSTWATGASYGETHYQAGGSTSVSTSMLAWYYTTCKLYNGTSWSTADSTLVSRPDSSGCGTSTSALCAGSYGLTSTEIYTA